MIKLSRGRFWLEAGLSHMIQPRDEARCRSLTSQCCFDRSVYVSWSPDHFFRCDPVLHLSPAFLDRVTDLQLLRCA